MGSDSKCFLKGLIVGKGRKAVGPKRLIVFSLEL